MPFSYKQTKNPSEVITANVFGKDSAAIEDLTGITFIIQSLMQFYLNFDNLLNSFFCHQINSCGFEYANVYFGSERKIPIFSVYFFWSWLPEGKFFYGIHVT